MLCCPPVFYDRKEIAMHYLHKILVHIPSATDAETDLSKAEILSAVIDHARSETESYYERAFDWREDESAGRWADTYPQTAYIAADDLEWFLKELAEVEVWQKSEIDSCLEELYATGITDLRELSEKLWSRDGKDYSVRTGVNEMTAYYLRCLAQHLYGEYRCDSSFFNTRDYTARLYKSDIEEIKQNPSEWALVMFDYHY